MKQDLKNTYWNNWFGFRSYVLAILFVLKAVLVTGQQHPNIVLVIIDDMGWKDMGCSGSKYYETPHIDAMAHDGLLFMNAYSASPVCSPSRGAIFTGKSPARTKFTTVFEGESAMDDRLYEVSKKRDGGANNQYYEAMHRHTLPSDEILFSQELKKSGYTTGYFGKWHCGIHGDYTPNHRGFDVALGYRTEHVPTAVTGHWGKTFRPYGFGLNDLKDDQYVADVLTDKCIDFMRENQNKPFLMVLSHYLVHNPIQAKPELVAKFKGKATTDQDNPEYAAMLASVDESLGRLNEELKQLGIEKNTMVIFTSDNGGLNSSTSNFPLLGGKSYAFEAAMRVPLIVKWPAVIRTQQISKKRVIGMDFYPTLLELADLKLRHQIDGESFVPELKGQGVDGKRRLTFHFPHYTGSTSPYSSIIEGDYKLIRFYNDETGAFLLFNLKEDPAEQKDLAEVLPKVTKQLAMILDNQLAEMGAELPRLNPNYRAPGSNLSNLESTYLKANRERKTQEVKLDLFNSQQDEK